jgi:hypothetical protein
MRKGGAVFRTEEDSLVLKSINDIIKADAKLEDLRQTRLLANAQAKDIYDLGIVIHELCACDPGLSVWKQIDPNYILPKIPGGRFFEEFF